MPNSALTLSGSAMARTTPSVRSAPSGPVSTATKAISRA